MALFTGVARQKARRARAAPSRQLHSEHGIQAAFFACLERIEHPAARSAFAIPNGAIGKNIRRRMYYGAEGCRKGISDVFVAYPSNGKHGLFLEFKYANNTPSPEQVEWLKRFARNGYAVAVPYTLSEALEAFYRYLNITLPPEILS